MGKLLIYFMGVAFETNSEKTFDLREGKKEPNVFQFYCFLSVKNINKICGSWWISISFKRFKIFLHLVVMTNSLIQIFLHYFFISQTNIWPLDSLVHDNGLSVGVRKPRNGYIKHRSSRIETVRCRREALRHWTFKISNWSKVATC